MVEVNDNEMISHTHPTEYTSVYKLGSNFPLALFIWSHNVKQNNCKWQIIRSEVIQPRSAQYC